jgi:hypothetical protein
MNELAPHNKNKNIRNVYQGINKLKEGYKARTNFFFISFGGVKLHPLGTLTSI